MTSVTSGALSTIEISRKKRSIFEKGKTKREKRLAEHKSCNAKRPNETYVMDKNGTEGYGPFSKAKSGGNRTRALKTRFQVGNTCQAETRQCILQYHKTKVQLVRPWREKLPQRSSSGASGSAGRGRPRGGPTTSRPRRARPGSPRLKPARTPATRAERSSAPRTAQARRTLPPRAGCPAHIPARTQQKCLCSWELGCGSGAPRASGSTLCSRSSARPSSARAGSAVIEPRPRVSRSSGTVRVNHTDEDRCKKIPSSFQKKTGIPCPARWQHCLRHCAARHRGSSERRLALNHTRNEELAVFQSCWRREGKVPHSPPTPHWRKPDKAPQEVGGEEGCGKGQVSH